jgi:hypothetical protein
LSNYQSFERNRPTDYECRQWRAECMTHLPEGTEIPSLHEQSSQSSKRTALPSLPGVRPIYGNEYQLSVRGVGDPVRTSQMTVPNSSYVFLSMTTCIFGL